MSRQPHGGHAQTAQPHTGRPALAGAGHYSTALAQAGGRELSCLMRAGDANGVCVALYSAPPYDLPVPALPVARLTITLTAARVSGGLDGDRPQRFDVGRHALFLTPAGAAAHWRKDAPSRHLILYFTPEVLGQGLHGAAGLDGATPVLLNAGLPGVRSIVEPLVNELGSGPLLADEAADSLARLLLVRLARHAQRQDGQARLLDNAQLARLRDYVQAHLTDRILVGDLAAAVGLPPHRFAGAFVRQTGQTPHQFVLTQRLQRALDLLQRSALGVAEVAAACGFASQQHLTHTMRQRLGNTPGRYRQGWRAGPPPG